jgi:uncharacterized protein YggE
MKASLLLFTAALFATPTLFAQQPLPPLVSTTGSAQIRVVPDLADLSFEIEVRNADLAVARKLEAERAAKLLAALRAAGVAEADLQSSQVQIAANYTDNRQETEKVKFFRVSQTISCTLQDVKKVPDITAEAVAAGATGVNAVSLRTSQLRKYRDEARASAIRAAKEKAIALATELGVKVGKPYTIIEGAGYDWRASLSNSNSIQVAAAGDAAGDGTVATFAPGTISISANVSVSFILE